MDLMVVVVHLPAHQGLSCTFQPVPAEQRLLHDAPGRSRGWL